jgi:hypothetical protein
MLTWKMEQNDHADDSNNRSCLDTSAVSAVPSQLSQFSVEPEINTLQLNRIFWLALCYITLLPNRLKASSATQGDHKIKIRLNMQYKRPGKFSSKLVESCRTNTKLFDEQTYLKHCSIE